MDYPESKGRIMARRELNDIQQIPNIGKAIERDLGLIGIHHPFELVGRDPYQLYRELCIATGKHHDHCLIDVFISAVRYMEGGESKKWWTFTQERKEHLDHNELSVK